MQTDHVVGGRRLLLFESDGLVAERLRHLASWEAFEVCVVDTPALFAAVAARLPFDLYVVGATHARALQVLERELRLAPLWLLVPLGERGEAGHFRLARPDAVLVDRALRDPEAFRNAWAASSGELPGASVRGERRQDPIRQTFEPFGLSDRQLEVLACALSGSSTREIAAELFISEPTVRNHLHAIYERVGVSGRRELFGRFVRGLMTANA